MRTLNDSQIDNLNNLIYDETIGNVMRYCPEDRIFITDQRILIALDMLAGGNTPQKFPSVAAAHRALEEKFKEKSWELCGIRAFEGRLTRKASDAKRGRGSRFHAKIYKQVAGLLTTKGYLALERIGKISACRQDEAKEVRGHIAEAAKELPADLKLSAKRLSETLQKKNKKVRARTVRSFLCETSPYDCDNTQQVLTPNLIDGYYEMSSEERSRVGQRLAAEEKKAEYCEMVAEAMEKLSPGYKAQKYTLAKELKRKNDSINVRTLVECHLNPNHGQYAPLLHYILQPLIISKSK